ncbi:MAG: helix-turn-helix domain-containing protein [Parvularculaceae bacterium]
MTESHPLKAYLQDAGETVSAFARRACVSRQTLYRIIAGEQIPKPALARRIVEATGETVALADLYVHACETETRPIADFTTRRPDAPELNESLLALTLDLVTRCLRPAAEPPLPAEALAMASEAMANTYTALSRVTTRRGQARLAQALRPVLEEILKEYAAPPPPARHLDQAAAAAAAIYYRCLPLREQQAGR